VAIFVPALATAYFILEGATIISGAKIGEYIGGKISDTIKSDVWKERTET
jgi:hypothetical protein